MPVVAYSIRTPRLLLRCWEPTDAPKAQEAIVSSLDHLSPWLAWIKGEPLTLDQRIEQMRRFRGWFDNDQDYVYAVFDLSGETVIGGTGLHPRVGPDATEIGYWVAAAHTRKGYCTEVAAVLTRVAIEVLGKERVEIHCDPHNAASAGVPKKLGFVHDATLRARMRDTGGAWRDSMHWSMLASELPKSAAAQFSYQAFDACGRPLPRPL